MRITLMPGCVVKRVSRLQTCEFCHGQVPECSSSCVQTTMRLYKANVRTHSQHQTAASVGMSLADRLSR